MNSLRMRARLARIEKQMRVYKGQIAKAQAIQQSLAEAKGREVFFRRERQAQQERQAQEEQQARQQEQEKPA